MSTSDFSIGDLEQGLRPMYLYWHSVIVEDGFPSLTALGLPNAEFAPDILSIYEIERTKGGETTDFKALYVRCKNDNTLRDKFVGTRLSQHQGFGPGSLVWTAFSEIAATPKPLLVSLPYVGPLPNYQSTAEIYLPLLGETEVVEYILVGVVLLEGSHQCKVVEVAQAGFY